MRRLLIVCLLSLSPAQPARETGGWVKEASSVIEGVGKVLRSHQALRRPPSNFRGPRRDTSKYFPRCVVGPAKDTVPADVCIEGTNAPPDPRRLAQVQQMKSAAAKNIAFYDNLLVKGQKGNPLGLQCLEDEKARALDSIGGLVNQLKLQSDVIKKKIQGFRDRQNKLSGDIKDLHEDLHGGANQKGKSWAEALSPACRSIIGEAKLAGSAKTGGLVGLKGSDDFSKLFEDATLAAQNQSLWESDLQKKIKAIRDDVGRYGPAALKDFKGATGPVPQMDAAIKGIVDEKYNSFAKDYNTTKAWLKRELGYDMPPMNGNFSGGIKNFAANSEQHFRKKFVQQCVGSMPLAGKDILEGLRQENSTTQGGNVVAYRRKLAAILSGEGFIEDKLAAIEELDRQYRNLITLTYRGSALKRSRQTPSKFYKRMISSCQDKINEDRGDANSRQSLIARAVKDIARLRDKSRDFAGQIGNAIHERVAACDGRNLPAGSCQGKAMDPNDSGFCLKHASTCSRSVLKCHSEVDGEIGKRRERMKTLAGEWNKNMEEFVRLQESYLQRYMLPRTVVAMEQIRRHLPGAQWAYKGGSFIKLPGMEKHPQFGLTMRGGGELANLEELPMLIQKNLIGMIEGQKEKVERKYQDHIAENENNIKENKRRWEEVMQACGGVEREIVAAGNKANQERMRRFGQLQEQTRNFCAKYSALRVNPAAACGEEDNGNSVTRLYEEGMKVSAHINPEVLESLGEFRAYCDSYNNEASEDEGDGRTLMDLCEEHDNNFSEVKSEILQTVERLSEDDRNVSQFLNQETYDKDLLKEFTPGARRLYRRTRALLRDKGKTSLVDQLAAKFGRNAKVEELKQLSLDELYKSEDVTDPKELRNVIDLLKKSGVKDSATDLCQKIANRAKLEAALECKSEGKRGCFQEELDKIRVTSQYDGTVKDLLVGRMEVEGDKLGEQTEHLACLASPRNGRRSLFKSVIDAFHVEEPPLPAAGGLGR